ncbi:MAG: TusE/DsrC/DsvC family sulfur relay protein [Gammaproteobacteria bacterium]|nr:TusE/DsrC/DsvC family sulfur relay protein [Gammaproteobacteria bacterium]
MAQNSSQIVSFSNAHCLDVGGRQIALRPDGRLYNLGEWTPEVATALAAKEGLTLLVQHWKVLNALRDYYAAYNVSPVKKLLKRALKEAGHAALTSDAALDELFPGGVLLQGSRLAGVPQPMLDAELERATAPVPAKPVVTAPARQHFTGEFQFNGETYKVTQIGNLIDLHRWNPQLAEFMASQEGITLSADHWEVLNFLRAFYFEYGVTPMVKILMKHMAEEVGAERASREHLYHLFPKGPSRQGSRIAGLPEPQGCIDG